MKKLLLLLLCVPLIGLGQFREIDWGSSEYVIEKKEGKSQYISSQKFDWGTEKELLYKKLLNKFFVQTNFLLLNNKLVLGSYHLDDNYYKKIFMHNIDGKEISGYIPDRSTEEKLKQEKNSWERYVIAYEDLVELLTETYGKSNDDYLFFPRFIVDSEKNKIIKDRDSYGEKIAFGKLQLHTTWSTPATEIECYIKGNSANFTVGIIYESKHYKDLLLSHEKKKKQASSQQQHNLDGF